MAGIAQRMLGAALLDVDTYEEVEADRGATKQALAVVLLYAVAAGIGGIENSGVTGIAYMAVATLAGWWIWAWVAYMIGTRLLPRPETEADHGQLLRTIGFSSAPGVLLVFAIIPPISGYVFLVCNVWMLVAMVIGVRQALDYEGSGALARAIAVCALGFPVYALIQVVTLLILGPWPI
jgi:hypothetical protein